MKATVDRGDFKFLNQWKWCVASHGYAVRRNPETGGHIVLHRFIMGALPGQYVDHIDGDKLNNRRSNLRLCEHYENLRNAKKHRDGKSLFKGVYWNKHANKWHAQLKYDKTIRVHIGYFSDQEAAAHAYDAAARKYHGKFAKLNFP